MAETRKSNFLKFLDNAIANQKGIEVHIDDPSVNYEVSISNSNTAVADKKKEYEWEYDNDLRFINDKSIRIKSYNFI